MKKILLILVTILISANWWLMPEKAEKASAATVSATFNPNLLISDADFTNKNAKSAAQIQAFMLNKGSAFTNYTVPEYVNVPFPYRDGAGNARWGTVAVRQHNDGSGENLYGMKMSTLIYQEAQQHGINPEVLIILMQRESSSITQGQISDTRKAWPIFYGFNEAMAGFKLDYATSRQRAIDYGGAGQQIAYATWWLRDRYDRNIKWGGYPIIDGQVMSPGSRATQVLYVYTPHIYWGNYNFWKYYYNWFANFPDPFKPVAIKTATDARVFLSAAGYRWLIGSSRDAAAWNYKSGTATVITDEAMAAIPYKGKITRLIKGSSSLVYVVDSGYKRHITSVASFSIFGVSWNNLIKVPDSLLKQIPTEIPVGGLVKSSVSPGIYLVSGGTKHYVPSYDVMRLWGFGWGDISTVSAPILNAYAAGNNLSMLVKGPGPEVYAMLGGYGAHVSSADVWNAWQFRWSDLTYVDSRTMVQINRVPFDLTRMIKGPGPDIYFMENCRKRHIITASAFNNYTARYGGYFTIYSGLFNSIPTGGDIR